MPEAAPSSRTIHLIHLISGGTLACAFWPNLLGASVSPRWALAALLPPLLAQQVEWKVAGLLSILLCWPALTLLWTPDPFGGLNDLIRLIILCGAVLLGASIPLRGVLLGLTYGVALSALLVPLQLLGHSPIEELISPSGLFSNRDILGETAAPLLVWTLAARPKGWQILSVVLCGALLATQSRVGVLALGVGCLFLWPRRGIWGAFLCLGVIGLIGLLDPSKVGTFGERLHIWQDALSDPRVWGHGLESFTSTFPRWSTAHSDLLQAFYELGALPTTLGVLGAGVALWRLHLSKRAEALPSWGPSGEACAFYALCCEACVSFPLHMPTTLFLGGLLSGHLASRSHHLRHISLRGRMALLRPDEWAAQSTASGA